MAKNKKPRKSHIKQTEFEDYNFSSIESHPRQGKRLRSPYSQLPNVQFTSWRDDFLPNMLWAAVLTASASREEYLKLFTQIVGQSREIAEPDQLELVHTYLAALAYEEFAHVMAPLKEHAQVYANLSVLRLFDTLPDRDHWLAFTSETPIDDPVSILARAIAMNFDHQSETATDLRWLKVIHLIVNGRMKYGPKFEEQIEEIRLYPNHGDMRMVRPNVRAFEMSTRAFEHGPEKPPHARDLQSASFWDECLAKTECVIAPKSLPDQPHRAELLDELTVLSLEIAEHFDCSAPGTGIDPRKDGAFGLVLYAVALLMEAAASRTHQLAGGRMILRSMTEGFITLHYLRKKDDPTIWKQYRNYGIGQAKLSFLKLVREDTLPDYVSITDLHDLANEDTWMEFQDIDLGAWQGIDLRKMAEASDCKDAYDRFYGWTSGFSHGQWTAIRDVAFTTCVNPLHRFHRVPAPMGGYRRSFAMAAAY